MRFWGAVHLRQAPAVWHGIVEHAVQAVEQWIFGKLRPCAEGQLAATEFFDLRHSCTAAPEFG